MNTLEDKLIRWFGSIVGFLTGAFGGFGVLLVVLNTLPPSTKSHINLFLVVPLCALPGLALIAPFRNLATKWCQNMITGEEKQP